MDIAEGSQAQATGRRWLLTRAERRRRKDDAANDRLLETETGRQAYWDLLGLKASRSGLIRLLADCLSLPGDVIECGVYRGDSVRVMSHCLKTNGAAKQVYACDSYEGFPQDAVLDIDRSFLRPLWKLRRKFRLAQDVPQRLKAFFALFGVRGTVVKGYFSETLPAFRDHDFCFIHIDCDLYESHLDCLNALYERCVPGGVIAFDDYAAPKWPGATRAVDEFFADKPEKLEFLEAPWKSTWYVRKQGRVA